MCICALRALCAYLKKTNVKVSFGQPTWAIWFPFPDFKFKCFQTRSFFYLSWG